MDPVSSTYGNASAQDSLSAFRTRQQDSIAPDSPPARGEAQTTPLNPAIADSQVQLGIQPSKNRGEEFQPYSPESLRPRSRTPDPARPEKKEPPQLQPPEVKQEDPQIQQIIAQLKSTEEKVKAHEAAHKSGGAATGPISYSYTRGPDGKNYITGGEVPITISSGNTPQETVSRMQQVIQAALAPADPSPQDRAVAAQAAAIQQAARLEQTSSQPTATGDPKTTGDTGTDARTDEAQKGLAAQQSRQAYSDPAVAGKDAPTATPSTRTSHNDSIPLSDTGPDAGTGTSNQPGRISSLPTGFRPPQIVSVYS